MPLIWFWRLLVFGGGECAAGSTKATNLPHPPYSSWSSCCWSSPSPCWRTLPGGWEYSFSKVQNWEFEEYRVQNQIWPLGVFFLLSIKLKILLLLVSWVGVVWRMTRNKGQISFTVFNGPKLDDCLAFSVPESVLVVKLDWCDPGVWRCQPLLAYVELNCWICQSCYNNFW